MAQREQRRGDENRDETWLAGDEIGKLASELGVSVASDCGQVQVAHQVGVTEHARALGEKQDHSGNEQHRNPEPDQHGVIPQLELTLATACDGGGGGMCGGFAFTRAAGRGSGRLDWMARRRGGCCRRALACVGCAAASGGPARRTCDGSAAFGGGIGRGNSGSSWWRCDLLCGDRGSSLTLGGSD